MIMVLSYSIACSAVVTLDWCYRSNEAALCGLKSLLLTKAVFI